MTLPANLPPPPPLMPVISVFDTPDFLGEKDLQAYRELLARVSADIEPRDVLEKIWIADIVYLQVEILQLRRLKNERVNERINSDFLHGLSCISLVDQMMAMAERRRDGSLRSLERHREMLGKMLQGALKNVDAEFEIVEPNGSRKRVGRDK